MSAQPSIEVNLAACYNFLDNTVFGIFSDEICRYPILAVINYDYRISEQGQRIYSISAEGKVSDGNKRYAITSVVFLLSLVSLCSGYYCMHRL